MELKGGEYSRVGQKFVNVSISKMKFHHPILDTFSLRKFDHISPHKQHMDKLTCMLTDFQVIFSSHFCAKRFWEGCKYLFDAYNYVIIINDV